MRQAEVLFHRALLADLSPARWLTHRQTLETQNDSDGLGPGVTRDNRIERDVHELVPPERDGDPHHPATASNSPA